MTQGCDGALYVNELGSTVARVAPGGAVQEYPTRFATLGAIASAPDCVLWFTAGRNEPQKYVGTLTFIPRSIHPGSKWPWMTAIGETSGRPQTFGVFSPQGTASSIRPSAAPRLGQLCVANCVVKGALRANLLRPSSDVCAT